VAPGFAGLPLGELARRTAVVLLVVLAFAAAVWLLLQVREIVLWLVISVVLAMALEPAVAWLTRHRLRRGLAAVLVSLIALAVLLVVVALLAVPLVNQARQLVDDLPNYVHDLTRPGSPFGSLETRFHIVERLKELAPRTLTLLVGAGTPALQALKTTFALIAAAVSILTLTVLLLIDGPRVWQWTLSLLPVERRPVARDLAARLLASIGGYVRGNLLISLIAGVTAYIAMLVAGVPFALPLAVAVGVLDLIPLVGATLGAILCVVVALAGVGWLPAAGLAVYFIVYQQIENNLIQTIVYSRTVALSPLAVLVATLCGAAVAGIVGVLLAIPVAAAVTITIIEIRTLRAAPAPGEALATAGEPAGGAPPAAAD
jgi:predicted PurR-regulated permease PerM